MRHRDLRRSQYLPSGPATGGNQLQQRPDRPAAWLLAEARRQLPILEARLRRAERAVAIAAANYRLPQHRRGHVEHFDETIASLRIDVESCRRIVEEGIPSWQEMETLREELYDRIRAYRSAWKERQQA